jgi:hypothetical protein
MKKQYKKPIMEVVIVNYHPLMEDISQTPFADAKEGQMFDEDEMQEWNDIFSNDRKDPWDSADDIWK